jgi:hypothetical protein
MGAYDFHTWIDMEVFFKSAAGTAEIEVRLQTVPVLHLISETIAAFDSAGFIHQPSSAVHFMIDDFRIYDATGSVNNTWLGTRRAQLNMPGANGATLDFTRSNTGVANWQNWINQAVDDTLYLYTPNIGDVNLSTVTPMTNAAVVAWVQVTSFVRQDDATQRFVKNRIVSSGVTADGASFPTTQSYSADHDVWELDPNTGLQFTSTAVNALSIGLLVYA